MMDAMEIIYRIRLLGKSQKALAQELSVSPGVISNVIYGRATSFKVAEYIARLLHTDPQTLWPDSYVFKPRTNRSFTSTHIDIGDEP